jgi:hypothetical protein
MSPSFGLFRIFDSPKCSGHGGKHEITIELMMPVGVGDRPWPRPLVQGINERLQLALEFISPLADAA